MHMIFTARGGRLTKWKGRVASIAPGVVAIVVATGGSVQAAETTYTLDATAPPSVASAALSDIVNEQSTAKLQATVTDGAISAVNASASQQLVSDVTSNTVTASVTENSALRALDLGINNTSGTTSNTVLTSAMRNATNDAYAAIKGTQITNTPDLSAASSATLSNNTMNAGVTLSTGSLTLQGSVANGFANSDAGASSITTTAVSPATADTASTAGLLIQSVQSASDVQNATTQGTAQATGTFANITGSDIDLSVTDASGNNTNSATISLESNKLAASFTGNTMTTGIDVQTGGMSTLSSTAGITSVQSADKVGIDGATTLTSAKIAADSGIGVTVAGGIGSTSIDVTSNALTAAARLNTGDNTLTIASGMSVTGQSSYGALDTDLAATSATVAAADLFVSNLQQASDSNVSSLVAGADGIAVDGKGSLSSASLSVTKNQLAATTEANTVNTSLSVLDANALTGTVSTTSVQTFKDSTAYDADTAKPVAQATAEVSGATLTLDAATTAAGDPLVGSTMSKSTVELSSNRVTASTSLNTATQQSVLSGNVLNTGETVATTTTGALPKTTLAAAGTIALESGYASGNLQIAKADTASTDPLLSAKVTGDGSSVVLTAGNAAATLNDSSLAVSGNGLSASGAANTSIQKQFVEANTLTASVATGNLQTLSGSLLASNTGSGIALAGTGSASNTSLAADTNTISSGVTANVATNVTSVTANQLAVLGSAIGTDADTSRSVLTSNMAGDNSLTATAALSLLNEQTTSPAAGTGITSSIAGGTVSNTLANGTDGTSAKVTLSADANQLSSMARANTATNVLSVDLGSVDMTKAFINTTDSPSAGSVGGTNLAVLGSAQENTSNIRSQIDALGTATGSAVTASLSTGTGDVSGSSLSASSNRLSSLASGNSVTNEFDLAATNLVTPDATAEAPSLTLANGASSISGTSAAIVVGNEQQNSGTITSNIGESTTVNAITASIIGTRNIGASSVAANDNRILAQAVAASGSTTTATIDATNLATSALVGSAQNNTGDLSAAVGDATGGVMVQAKLDSASTTSNSSLDASRNLVGATATALVDQTTLRLGNADTAVLAGTAIGNSAEQSADATSVALTADYALAERQTNTAASSATVTNSTVQAIAGTFTGGSVTTDANILVAQANGVQGTTLLSAQSAVIGSSDTGLSNPLMVLASKQVDTGAITGTLDNAAVKITTGSLGTTSNGETISMASNSLAATAAGVTGANQLVSAAEAGASGLIGMGDSTTTVDGSNSNSVTADRVLLSDQSQTTGAVTANMTNGPLLSIDLTSANGATVAMSSNAIEGTATGVDGANSLTNSAGATNSVSSAVAASQYMTSNVSATVTQPELAVLAGATGSASILQDSNTISATAKGLTETNRLVTSGGAIDPVTSASNNATSTGSATDGATVANGFSTLISQQKMTGAATATLDAAADGGEAAITTDLGAVTSSSVGISGNLLSATASGIEGSNLSAEISDTYVDHTAGSGGMALLSDQIASGTTKATVGGADLSILAASANGSNLSVDGNAILASASSATATNRTALMAETGLTGAGGSIASASDAITLKGASSLMNRQTVSGSTTSEFVPETDALGGMYVDVTGASTNSSALSVSSNTMRSAATGAQATNLSTLQAGSITDTTASLANDQSNSGTTTARLESAAFGVTGGAVTGSVDVSGNRSIAAATAASASNSLAMTSDSLIDGSGGGTVTLANTATGNLTSTGAPTAALLNRQASSGSVLATLQSEGNDTAMTTLTGALTGSLSVDSNLLVSQGRGNYADNSLAVSAAATITDGAQAVLASNQNRSGSIDAFVDGSSDTSKARLGASLAGVTGSLSVDNNLLRASGAANTVINSMTVDTAGFTASQSGGSVTASDTPSVSSTGQFMVLNGQQTSSDVTARVSNYTIGASAGALNGSASVSGNMAMADATGNSSIATLRLAAAGTGAIAPIALVNSQSNSGNMSADVSGVSFSGSGSASTGSTNLSGNSISANATGNLSSSTVGAPGSVFTSF